MIENAPGASHVSRVSTMDMDRRIAAHNYLRGQVMASLNDVFLSNRFTINELALRLGWPVDDVRRVFEARRSVTMRKVAELAWAMRFRVDFELNAPFSPDDLADPALAEPQDAREPSPASTAP